jgi:hypothetical protein
MAKAMLIMDMPSSCNECELKVLPNPWSFMICGKTKKHIERGNQRPTWCPLREAPQKMEKYHKYDAIALGYNACIDEILGGGE